MPKKITVFKNLMGHINDYTVKRYDLWHPKHLEFNESSQNIDNEEISR
jgi:hypothetical protein